MKEKLKPLNQKINYLNYGVSEGDAEIESYECPCGRGTVTAVFKKVPGFKDEKVTINCKSCNKEYEIDIRNGCKYWDIKPKAK